MSNLGNASGVVITNVKYTDCMKNHAIQMGLNILDGCMEFMPKGKENTVEALKCAACGCHRNFHKKVVELIEEVDDNFSLVT